MLLLGVNNVKIWKMPLSQVAALLRDAALATEKGTTVRLAFLPSPLVTVDFKEPPLDMVLAQVPAPGGRHLTVITGFQPSHHPGPMERSGKLRPGDALLAANGLTFPGPSGDLHEDLKRMGGLSYPATFTFRRRRSTGGTEDLDVHVEGFEPQDRGRLWAHFTMGQDGRPEVSRFSRPPGAGAQESRIRPGMVLQTVGTVAVEGENWTADVCMERIRASKFPGTVLSFLDMELLFAIQRNCTASTQQEDTQEGASVASPGTGRGGAGK